MSWDIDVICDDGVYRLLHGHLHLAMAINLQREVTVNARGDGRIKILRCKQGYVATKENRSFPLLLQ
jgi:hypothetical protein